MILAFFPFLYSVTVNIPKVDLPDIGGIVKKASTITEERKKEIADRNRGLATFKDPNFSISTNNFQKGETIYVKIEGQGGGDIKKKARLLDANKNLLSEKNLEQRGNEPKIFTAVFSAPEKEGVYYIDVEIKGTDGFSFSSQNNINIGSNNSVSINSKAVATANSGSSTSSSSVVIESGEIKITTSTANGTGSAELKSDSEVLEELLKPIKSFFEKLLSLFKI